MNPRARAIVGLLFLATFLNYTDRLVLGNAQAAVLREFVPLEADRNRVWGNLNFAFGVSFALFQIVAGFLADRFSLRAIYLGAILLWSAAGAATGFVPAGAVAALMACRVVLGVGEAFNWPCAVACVRRVVPRESRGFANGLFHSGASLGAIATPFLVLAMTDADGTGWRNVFVLVGGLGILWAVAWVLVTAGPKGRIIDGAEEPTEAKPPLAGVFADRRFYLCLITGVCVNLAWHFYNQWFPRFLSQDIQLDLRPQQWVQAGFYLAADLGSVLAGYATRKLADRLPVERTRQIVMSALAVSAAFWSTAAFFAGSWELQLACFYGVAASLMGGFSIFFGLAQDIAAGHTAQILGVCGCVSWLVISGVTLVVGGYAGPGLYAGLFLAVGCVPLIAAAAGWLWPRGQVSAATSVS